MAPKRRPPSALRRTTIALGIVAVHAMFLWGVRQEARPAPVRAAGTKSSDQTGLRRVVQVQLVAPGAELAGRAETQPRPQQVAEAERPAAAATTLGKSDAKAKTNAAASPRAAPKAPAPSVAAQTPLAPAPQQASPDAAAATALAASASVQTTPAATVRRTVDAVLCPTKTVQYPARAMRLGLQGRVQLRLLLGQDGAIRETTVAVSSGHDILDDAAVAAMQGLRCDPYVENGHPMSALVTQLVEFSLATAR